MLKSPAGLDDQHWAVRCQPTSVEAVTTTTLVNLLIGIAVLVLLVYRQLQVRPVRANFRLPLILAIIGVVQLSQFLQHNRHTDTVFAALAGSLVLAAITGAIRAMTVRVWIQGGQALRQGTWITALLWIVSLGVHLGYDYLVAGKGPAVRPGLGVASPVLRGHLHHPAVHPPGQGPADRGGPPAGRQRPHPVTVIGGATGRNALTGCEHLSPGPRYAEYALLR